jgi:MFS family permease
MRVPDGTTRRFLGLGSALTLAMVFGGLVRASLPVLSTEIRAEFELSRSGFGSILAAYLVALAVSAPTVGRMTDAVGGRRALLARFAGASIGLLLVAVAPTAWLLGVAVALTGAGMSAGNPGTNKLIADLVPPGQRGTLMGIKQSGGQLGVLLAGTALPFIAGAWSWQAAIAALIAVPVGGAALLLAVVPRDPPRRRLREAPALAPATRRELRPFFGMATLMGIGVQAAFGFLPLYASERLGMSLSAAGLLAGVVAGTSTLGRIAWGRVADRADRAASPAAILALASAGGVAAIALATTVGPWLVWVGAAALGLSAESWNAVANVILVRTVGGDAAGRASGQLMFVALMAGAAGPYAFGAVVDVRDSYAVAWTAVALVFLAAASVAVRWRGRTPGSSDECFGVASPR